MPVFKRKYAWTLGCLSLLAGCTHFYPVGKHSGVNIHPVMQVRQPDRSADRLYNLGRYHHRRTEYQDAITAYRQALAVDPAYVEAHNGLGIVYAIQGRHALSLQHFRQAIAMMPAATYLHSNLGYALQLQESYAEAAAAYQEALRLDPLNHKARKNLAHLNRQLGLDTTAATATAAEQSTTSDTSAANVAQARPEPVSRIVQIAPNVYELRDAVQPSKTGSVMQTAPASHVAAETASAPQNKRIEVSNGNGISGMARKVANFLAQAGYPGARLTNHPSFQQASTEIHYRPGHQAQAEHMRSMLPNGVAKSFENNSLRDDIGVKILLGKDLQVAIDYFNPARPRQLALNER
ncbi:LytR C-terminal domain-containing protein [Nitrosomonas sp. ANs5]|uniref:LytR C-terminal domain-containing protein n=1 Tax=Nitrosomonas sp. ANs5 TaxID=3423941 RepID=UPI003D3357EF